MKCSKKMKIIIALYNYDGARGFRRSLLFFCIHNVYYSQYFSALYIFEKSVRLGIRIILP